jgi:hypothetical protein
VSLAPWWVGPATFGAGLLAALGFAVGGIATLVRRALALKKRIDSIQDLPLEATIAETSRKLERAQRSIDQIPTLFLRVQAALQKLEESRNRLQAVATTAQGLIGFARQIFAPPKRH